MSQPHPPIPEPQPHPSPDLPDDEPRTQSILLPPSQRQSEQADEPAQDWAPPAEPPSPDQPLPGQPAAAEPAPAPPATGQFPQPAYQPTPQPTPQPTYAPGAPAQVTGPIDFVPGFAAEHPPVGSSGSSAATAPPPSSGPTTSPGAPGKPPPAHRRSPFAAVQRAGRGGTALLSLVLAVLAVGLLQLGLALDFGNQSLWEVVPTWSAFATVAALLVLAPSLAGLTGRLPARTAWRIGAVGAAGLTVAWVLVALPLAASDRGFWLTAAVAAAGAALWLAPGRTE